MANLKDVFSKLVKSAGLPEDNESVKLILANEELSKIDVDPVVSNILLNNLMNEESAKNNPKLSNHFRATLLNGVDAKIEEVMKDLEFPDEKIAEVMANDKTTGKIAALKAATRDLFEKKGKGKQNDIEIEKERKLLNDKIAELQSEIPRIKEEEGARYSGQLRDRDFNSLLGSYEYSIDISKKAATTTARTLVEEELAKKGWKIDYKIEDINNPFRLLNESNLEVYQDNQPVSLKSFSDKVLADNKLLKVSQSNTTTTSASNANNSQKHIQGNNSDYTSIISDTESQIAKLQNA